MKTIRAITIIALAAVLLTACQPFGKKLPKELSAPKNDPFVLKGVSNLKEVSQITGAKSPNKTNRYGVYGQDLGSMINFKGKTYFVFGDTFGYRSPGMTGGGGSDWRSNTIAVSSDTDPSDGITLDKYISDYGKHAKEVIPSLKVDNKEMTKIPTYGISVGNNMYLYFMSVKHWGTAGNWVTNYSGVSKSTDGGEHWKILKNLKWPGDSNFIQMSIYKVKFNKNLTEIYFWCIPAGRTGNVKLMKVDAKKIEDFNAYQYFAGLDKKGNPLWSKNMKDAKFVAKNDVGIGELSVVWNPYLKHWIMTYLKKAGSVVIREGLEPWGPWGKEITLADKEKYPGLYAPFMNPKFTANGGKTIFFTLSLWNPYNVFWMKADLQK